jgi:hypothetical protein
MSAKQIALTVHNLHDTAQSSYQCKQALQVQQLSVIAVRTGSTHRPRPNMLKPALAGAATAVVAAAAVLTAGTACALLAAVSL